MSIQGQLAQSQAPPIFLSDLVFGFPVETGVLGNHSVQSPANLEAMSQSVRLREAAPNRAISAPESLEMVWLVRNAQELARHRGEWLLIQGAQLLVHSRDFAVVRTAVEQRQIRSPFVYYVPTDEESNSVTI